jgi:hypothetical protein
MKFFTQKKLKLILICYLWVISKEFVLVKSIKILPLKFQFSSKVAWLRNRKRMELGTYKNTINLLRLCAYFQAGILVFGGIGGIVAASLWLNLAINIANLDLPVNVPSVTLFTMCKNVHI